MLLNPLGRLILAISQMQLICKVFNHRVEIIKNFRIILVLNTSDLSMGRYKDIARFGLMHMVATNICEWLYILVEETKHEIWHLAHTLSSGDHNDSMPLTALNDSMIDSIKISNQHGIARRAMQSRYQTDHHECQRTNIMGSLVQNSSPFLFPCTIEYSLICAVILFDMWKKVSSISKIIKARKKSEKTAGEVKSVYHFSIDCSRANQGIFAGVVTMVLTIICLIIYFVLHENSEYHYIAIREVTFYETVLYSVCVLAVLLAFFRVRDLKFQKDAKGKLIDLVKSK